MKRLFFHDVPVTESNPSPGFSLTYKLCGVTLIFCILFQDTLQRLTLKHIFPEGLDLL